ncbi:hypothetical protein QBC44DRAFT_233995 [Cladorrhinum sp. PSN332]|nr:hypothetical protein QBC44DRAFT_233995 [Cladorrhinum sp. PSN332]
MENKKTKRSGPGQQKRRACDECRGRKLACSKELDGCARCKREGIQCIYSAQKQMGRPRKRVNVDNVSGTRKDEQPVQQQILPEPAVSPSTFVMPEFDAAMGMELDLSFLDMSNTDINFLDLLEPGADFPLAQECSTAPLTQPTNLAAAAPPPSVHAVSPVGFSTAAGFWSMGNQIENIDFNANTYQLGTPEPNPEFTSEQVTNLIASEIAEFNDRLAATTDRVPSLSPPSSTGGEPTPSSSTSITTATASSSSSSSPSSKPTTIPQTCSCLASLYLALESLKSLPNHSVTQAMRLTRAASRVAHDCVLCPVCGNIPPPTDPDALTKPPIAAIQSMMMLGAILPSLSNAYMQILTMVDNEAAAADQARRKMEFSLNEYGGLWGVLRDQEPYACGAAEKLEGAVLEPSLWRLTVRALLKVDVYGIEESRKVVCHDMRHVGLKDIIGMMEERSRNRHELMDEMIASGGIKPGPGYPTCLSIIDIAKRSMADLVIP